MLRNFLFGFWVVLMALHTACSTAPRHQMPIEISLPEGTPKWLRDNLEQRSMLKDDQVVLNQEGQSPDALIVLRDYMADELLVSIAVDGDTARVQWMAYQIPPETTNGESNTNRLKLRNGDSDKMIRNDFEHDNFWFPTTVWEDMVAHQLFTQKQAFAEGDKRLQQNFTMYKDSKGSLEIQHLHWGADGPKSWFQLLELIWENAYMERNAKEDPHTHKSYQRILDSGSKQKTENSKYIRLRINGSLDPKEEWVLYPVSDQYWKCQYKMTEASDDSLPGRVSHRVKNLKTGQTYFEVVLRDTSTQVPASEVRSFWAGMASSTLQHPNFHVRMAVLDGIHYSIELKDGDKIMQKSFGNPPSFLREVKHIENFTAFISVP